MRVAYVTTYDGRDPLAWSGSANRIARALEAQGCEILFVGPLRERWGPLFKAKHAWHKLVLRRNYTRDREPVIVRGFARQILAAIEGKGIDVIVSPGAVAIGRLDTPIPIVTWSDATFACLNGYYASCDNFTRATERMAKALEREAFARTAVSVFTSRWAAESAIRDCGADPARVRVIPFGAVLDEPPTLDQVEAAVARRPTDLCRLLFLAVEWDRKGGDVAMAAAAELNRMGIPTELHCVGITPPPEATASPFVRSHGFIKKFTTAGREKLDRIMSESHFLIMPSRAEAYGLAPCEANAWGVPGLCTATGGLTEVIRPGVNGALFPVDEKGSAYAGEIASLVRDPLRYRTLCRTSRQEYETRLNWDSAGRAMRAVLDEVVTASHGARV
jgi:glycosyltransferase involved in cell wall biosynthesis